MCVCDVCVCTESGAMSQNLSLFSKRIYVLELFPTLESEMHPGKEAGALHPEDRDEDVGDKDEEDDDGYDVVHAV